MPVKKHSRKETTEDELIERIKSLLGEPAGGKVALGIGDDAAILAPGRGGTDVLVTTDLLVEGTHFSLEWASPYQIGWKALAASVSDIAAMGGRPTAAFVSVGVRKRNRDYFIESLYQGINACAERYGVAVAGGDTVRSDLAVVNVALLGEVAHGRAIPRKGARPGDALLVTSTCGDSAAGLASIRLKTAKVMKMTPAMRLLADRHLTPEPSVEAGLAAAASDAVTAMMDLSDGLAEDLPRLAKRSGVGAAVRAADIPVSPELLEYCSMWPESPNTRPEDRTFKEPVDFALEGGEDYNLLIAADPAKAQNLVLLISNLGIPITPIGEITPRAAGITLTGPDGAQRKWPKSGFRHF